MAEAIFFRFMLMMTMWLPWRSEWVSTVTVAPLDLHLGCRGAWMGWDHRIHFCLGEHAGYYPMAAVHELQHWLYRTQLRGEVWDWDEFDRIAIMALREGNYTEQQMAMLEYARRYGGEELHAEIPWWTKGKIPPSLQEYYPWFNLEKTEKCPNGAD
jgi:hypothetical protein